MQGHALEPGQSNFQANIDWKNFWLCQTETQHGIVVLRNLESFEEKIQRKIHLKSSHWGRSVYLALIKVDCQPERKNIQDSRVPRKNNETKRYYQEP